MVDQGGQASGQKNPWDRERLLQYLNQPETPSLEFKSSRPLSSEKDRPKYVENLAVHASAFLNAEGGLLLIGLEEGRRRDAPEVATELSPGVPHKQLSAARLQSMLCDRIHPAVAGLIKVHSIPIDSTSEGELLAFAVEVRAGVTAYQAPDLKYYVRRGYSSEPMEDKDIRLRMLATHSARVSLAAKLDLEKLDVKIREQSISPGQMVAVRVLIRVTNVGVRTVRRLCIDTKLFPVTPRTKEAKANGLDEWTAREPRRDWTSEDAAERPLFPDDTLVLEVANVDISGHWETSAVELKGRFACFLDDALSTALEIDLSGEYREAIDLIRRRYHERFP